MIAYRVEHRQQGCGPFWLSHIHDDHSARNMPCPYEKGQNKIYDFIVASNYSEETRFAFRSLEALKYWFDVDLRRDLHDANFIIRVVLLSSRSEYAVSNTQIVYDRRTCVTLRLMRLNAEGKPR